MAAVTQLERLAAALERRPGERFRPDERLDPRTCLTCGLVPLWVMKHDTPADCIAELRNRNAILDMRLASINGATLRGRPKARGD